MENADIREYEDLVDSLALDMRRSSGSISFLIGSALSLSPDGTGVPNVKGMCDIIEEYMGEDELNIFDRFVSKNPNYEELSDVSRYQLYFTFLMTVGNANDVKEVLIRAMDKARNPVTGDWIVSKSLVDLSNIMSFAPHKIRNILTTNFDEIIEEAVDNNNLSYHQYNLVKDQFINIVRSNAAHNVTISHLHGIWNGDTMHTTTQLGVWSKRIKDSIEEILSTSTLYVIGYSGWDDIFIKSLQSVVDRFKSDYIIKWAFFDKNAASICNDNKDLFEALEPAITNGRFQGFKGVDCNKFFEDVIKELPKKKA